MGKFNADLVLEGLTAYTVERQNGWERNQPEDASTWMDQRRFWTDAILQSMVRLDGKEPDPRLMEQFDHALELARGSAATEPAPLKLQRETIRTLRCFVSALEATGDDRRLQVDVVRMLLDDMSSHLPWARGDNGLDLALGEAEQALRSMTTQMPIRFTHILLGGDVGPHWASGYASGAVTDAEAVKQTAIYQEAVRDYPEVKSWPALCTVYTGGGQYGPVVSVPASEFDLAIMNRAGDRFLKERGVRWSCGMYQMTVPVQEQIRVLKFEPGKAPEEVTMPNTLEAFQSAVGGYIETLGLDSGAVLICNEEGKLMGLPANRQVGGDIIAGAFLIAGSVDGEFCSLTDEDAARYSREFAQPLPSYGDPDEPTQWEYHVF